MINYDSENRNKNSTKIYHGADTQKSIIKESIRHTGYFWKFGHYIL